MKPADQTIVDSVKGWFEKAVLGLNLCPFAHKPYKEGKVQFVLSHATDDRTCLTDLYLQFQRLDEQPDIETLVIICASHLQLFTDYNQFLSLVDRLIEQEGWQGTYQVASFHPDYRFAETLADDLDNWTNRSPFPLLHLIREASIAEAVKAHKDIDAIPQQNIQQLRSLSETQRKVIFGRRIQAKKNRE